MIELISYNIRFGKTLEKIAAWINKSGSKPDLVCFQEFPESKTEEFKKMLNGASYSAIFAPAFSKKKHTYGELTAFRTETLKLVNSKIIDLGEHRIDRAVFRQKSHRSSLITEFSYGKKIFTVANVHLVVLALHKSRKKQLEMTIDEIKKKAPTIIVGDYNYSIFLGRKRGLINFMKKHNFHMAGERTTTHRLWKFPQQIDYAFYRGLDIRETKVSRVKYSDHFPLLVKFGV